MDLPRSVLNFRFFATAILHLHEEAYQTRQGVLNYVVREPVGVAGLISPWNLPLYLLSWKIAPALAAGNTVVCKPSELTPMTAYMLAEIMVEAGLPAGVCNMVFGKGDPAGEALCSHPNVPLISFTGGTATGQRILESTAPYFKKTSLELGGKNPNIIFQDAPLDRCLGETIRSSFLNQGEICLCGSRIFVQQSIFDSFLNQFVERTKSLKVGDPTQTETFLGPVVSREHRKKILSFIAQAVCEGGRVMCGEDGTSHDLEGGYFVRPTIITQASPSSQIMQEEVFGPVVTVTPFDTEEEVIEMANSVRYGLSASVWTENLSCGHRMAHHLKVGTVWINGWMIRDLRVPFGGMKSSGLGREGGLHTLDFFTEKKNVCINIEGPI